jgi:hypothetical protein
MKEKGLYMGIGILIGVGIGLLSFSKIRISNIGNIDRLTIAHCSKGCNNEEAPKQ